jgi:hypothetical protein
LADHVIASISKKNYLLIFLFPSFSGVANKIRFAIDSKTEIESKREPLRQLFSSNRERDRGEPRTGEADGDLDLERDLCDDSDRD